MLFPPIHPTPRREAALDRQERPPQALDTGKRARQVQRVFLYSLRSFGQATVWIGPKADEEDPMLDEHRQEFGIDLTQDAPGFGAARLVHAAMTLPQLEEQRDVIVTTQKTIDLVFHTQVCKRPWARQTLSRSGAGRRSLRHNGVAEGYYETPDHSSPIQGH